MTPILRAHTCHPEACTPRDPTIANCVTQKMGNQPTIGRSLTFVRDDNPRRLFAPLNPASPMPATTARTYLQMRPACPRRTFHAMHDLFAKSEAENLERISAAAPLAARMRPRTLDEFVGQEHILAPGKLLRRAIEADRLPSLIISGPPGSGKTTLAYVVAEMTHSEFIRLSGVESNVAEMRKVVAAAANRLRTSGRKTIVFIDEIHHFNKAQQDILLPDVESGNLRLIGATTYNPYFYVNSALVSRSLVFRLEPLTEEQLETLIDRALADSERGLGKYNVKMDTDARRHLAKLSAGEDFRFTARRIVIFASEDVGLADPEALPLAIAAQQAVEFVGMPEARIPLAHATAYMCRAKKSRDAYESLAAASGEIESEQTQRVPEHLKNKHFPVNPEA